MYSAHAEDCPETQVWQEKHTLFSKRGAHVRCEPALRLRVPVGLPAVPTSKAFCLAQELMVARPLQRVEGYGHGQTAHTSHKTIPIRRAGPVSRRGRLRAIPCSFAFSSYIGLQVSTAKTLPCTTCLRELIAKKCLQTSILIILSSITKLR